MEKSKKIDVKIKDYARNLDLTEEDALAQKHELFLNEIEAIEEYWGPTFR